MQCSCPGTPLLGYGMLTQSGATCFMQLRPYSSVSEFPIHVQKAPVSHLSLPGDPKIDSVSLHVTEVFST